MGHIRPMSVGTQWDIYLSIDLHHKKRSPCGYIYIYIYIYIYMCVSLWIKHLFDKMTMSNKFSEFVGRRKFRVRFVSDNCF